MFDLGEQQYFCFLFWTPLVKTQNDQIF